MSNSKNAQVFVLGKLSTANKNQRQNLTKPERKEYVLYPVTENPLKNIEPKQKGQFMDGHALRTTHIEMIQPYFTDLLIIYNRLKSIIKA